MSAFRFLLLDDDDDDPFFLLLLRSDDSAGFNLDPRLSSVDVTDRFTPRVILLRVSFTPRLRDLLTCRFVDSNCVLTRRVPLRFI